MEKNVESFAGVQKNQLIYAQKNMAFNALMFVWKSFLSVISCYDGKEVADSYFESFRPTYDLISKDFLPNIAE